MPFRSSAFRSGLRRIRRGGPLAAPPQQPEMPPTRFPKPLMRDLYLVGVPPIMGLYTIVPPLIAYALLGTSRLLVVGPDTATGLISALTVGAIAAQGTAEFNTLGSSLAILIGAIFLLFGALRMGWVAAFIPTPVM